MYYYKIIDGREVYQHSSQISVIKMMPKEYDKNGNPVVNNIGEIDLIPMRINNPSKEDILADGWIEFVEPELTEEELLNRAIQQKESDIKYYDQSSSVNEFFVNGISLWLDKNDRAGLMLRFQSELAMGKTVTTLWGNGNQFTLPLVDEDGKPGLAFQMLYALEVYASACYDNTQVHLSEIKKLTKVEDVRQYDYTLGYPDKLQF